MNALQVLLQKRDKLSDNLARLQKRAERTQQKIRAIREEMIAIENGIRTVRIASRELAHPMIATPSKKNLDVLRVWAALSELLSKSHDPRGVPVHQVKETIFLAVPGIPDGTVRSHLFRLKKRQLLEEHGNYWRLGPKSVVIDSKRAESIGS